MTEYCAKCCKPFPSGTLVARTNAMVTVYLCSPCASYVNVPVSFETKEALNRLSQILNKDTDGVVAELIKFWRSLDNTK